MEMIKEDSVIVRRFADEYRHEEFPEKFQELMVKKMRKDQLPVLNAIHEIISDLKENGGRMIDFGCGPTIYNVASASRYYKEIIMADYSDFNRREVEKWIKEDEYRLDWKPYLDAVARLEGWSDVNEGRKEIEKRIRSSVKKVIQCDILSDPPIPEEYGKFDLLLSSYCIESVCVNPEMYKRLMKKLCALLKIGGTLIIVSIHNGGPYKVHKTLYSYNVEDTLIKQSLEDSGLKLKTWFINECKGKRDFCDLSGLIVASAKKE